MPPDYNSQMHVAMGGSWQRAGSRLLRQLSIPTHARILDAGCGSGELALALARQVPEGKVVGMDADAACIHVATTTAAQHGTVNATFYQGDILDPSSEADTYDFVFSNSTLHLIAEARTALRNLIKVLRVGGRIAIQLPAHDSSDELYDALSKALHFVEEEALMQLWNSPYMPRPEELSQLLQELGLEEVRVMEEIEPITFRSNEDAAAYFEKLLLGPYLQTMPAAKQEPFLLAFGEAFPLKSGLPSCTLKRLYAHGTR